MPPVAEALGSIVISGNITTDTSSAAVIEATANLNALETKSEFDSYLNTFLVSRLLSNFLVSG